MRKGELMKTMCSLDMAWRTATKRTKLSKPFRWLRSHGLLEGRVLDYGCGRGDDADALGCERYDPHFFPAQPVGPFDTIVCNYVLNVIEEDSIRRNVLIALDALLDEDGCAYIAVRTSKRDLKGLTRIGTWQGLIKLDLPVLYSDSSCTIYEFRRGDAVKCIMSADTFGGGA